jgi:hypothetical protein
MGVWTECYAVQEIILPYEGRTGPLACGHIPENYSVIPIPRSEQFAIRTKNHTRDRLFMSLKRLAKRLVRRCLPEI